jgi:hypothetical protein
VCIIKYPVFFRMVAQGSSCFILLNSIRAGFLGLWVEITAKMNLPPGIENRVNDGLIKDKEKVPGV